VERRRPHHLQHLWTFGKEATCSPRLSFFFENSRDEEERDSVADTKCEREALHRPRDSRVQHIAMLLSTFSDLAPDMESRHVHFCSWRDFLVFFLELHCTPQHTSPGRHKAEHGPDSRIFVMRRARTLIADLTCALWFKNFPKRGGKDTQTSCIRDRILGTGDNQPHVRPIICFERKKGE
jgi:hypothetical protein